MVLSLIATLVVAQANPVWSGEFVLRITGEGKSKSGPFSGTWKIDREAKGKFVLDRSFKGAGIARTEDPKNEARYTAWIANRRQPATLKFDDHITLRGPLHSAKEIRFDTWQYQFPIPGKSTSDAGEVASAILQIDSVKGTYTLESPRIYAAARSYFKRVFVEGPPKWVATKPFVQDEVDLQFDIIGGLNSPTEWTKMSGPFKPGQREIVLTRKLPFTAPLATMPAAKLNAEIVCVLKLNE